MFNALFSNVVLSNAILLNTILFNTILLNAILFKAMLSNVMVLNAMLLNVLKKIIFITVMHNMRDSALILWQNILPYFPTSLILSMHM